MKTTSGFLDVVKQDTPRFVIQFWYQSGKEQFKWGIVGQMPLVSLIGYVTRVQAELPLLEPEDVRYDCPEPALVIAWTNLNDTAVNHFRWFVHPQLPVDSLVGTMEVSKAMLVAQQVAQLRQATPVNQSKLLGPDGQPMQA